jgi:FeoB-associated Cys-rich membrane protein
MSSSRQTIIALGLVVLAAALLIRSVLKKRKQPGCGSEGCGAVSPEVKKLQAKLKR